ncbi:MAG: 4a-hydroxytetrahydrobiopterin dehydratase [Trichodesmium sp. St16_bin4-tuft]|nr:4a-hydroxytetrahydrobiopterin dehydratase [Trichodesmium sp. MAG_R01]MDE5068592.1 4a-hydroxytetrahydrobiopterin dehydratase [Trichodesmium sp. St4_bin8_1]MDE5071709.1 4a-hydroxytetrahydrobiopterin dehydratase [Trichodesmium sp. St5_bin8]MDE5077788.1 4a-hydroxytetrahydrobiopterin dehydratase [Trichodesmium sp. St2_bin6]MDE5092443.1 4a-hydroxytetrahydrobiopterin dehydratase [Trichodesmium sp. St18_bin3_1_1]MDE5098682.1 4a-hydroxytetrahydrobiopterin dehydratase [Trichodesmium sp. St16_bin4-tuf
MTELLAVEEINQRISQISGWKLEGNKLKYIKTVKNFVEAINFVNKLVAPAEASQHHPDLEVSYNKVTVILTTHDSGGLTEKDFSMAQTISGLS